MRPLALWPAWALVLGSAGAGALGLFLLAGSPRPLVRENYAGRPVPATLGPALVVAAPGAAMAVAWWWGRPVGPAAVGAVAAMVAVGAAGLADDLSRGGPRGLAGHLASLLRGRPTTGILKLAAGVAAGVTLALLLGGPPLRVAAAAVLVAACANVWNALDVVPGRALKWGALALALVLAPLWDLGPPGLVVAATLGASVGLLPFDLRERAMLGDAGSNPLGLVVGWALAVALPDAGVVVAAAVAVLLQVAAETVTLSGLIEAVPPLRWFDRLGRRASMGRG